MKYFLCITLILVLVLGCKQAIPPICQNSTIFQNTTIEKIVYVDKPIERIVHQDRIVYRNITANCSAQDKINKNLQQKLQSLNWYMDNYMNLTNCTDYIDLKDNQSRVVSQLSNCTYNLRRTNSTLNECIARLENCVSECD